jgi:hypothetical protein
MRTDATPPTCAPCADLLVSVVARVIVHPSTTHATVRDSVLDGSAVVTDRDEMERCGLPRRY